MPVTAKLSQAFYAKLGDELANELVNWFNAVDATYRADLRDLNELNFARFDARLEQRIAQLDAKLEQRAGQLEARIEQRIAQVEALLAREIARIESKFDIKIDTGLASLRADLIKWMFAFWVGNLAIMIALLKL